MFPESGHSETQPASAERSNARWGTVWHRALRVSGYALAALIILAALSVSLLRLLVPMVPDYRQQIEERVSEMLDTRMRVERIDARWRGLGPDLVLEGVTLINPRSNLPFLRFSQVEVSLDPVASLMSGTLQTGHLRLTGGRLNVLRTPEGRLLIGGLTTPTPDVQAGDSDLVLAWLLRSASLGLLDTHVHFEDHAREDPIRYDFTDVNLLLVNSGSDHRLSARVDLPEHLGEAAELLVRFSGPSDRPEDWQGDLYLQVQDLRVAELARLVDNPWLRVETGRASARVWGSWRERTLDDLRLDFEARALTLQRKLPNGQAPVGHIERANGILDVRRPAAGSWRVDLRGFETAWTEGTTAPVDGMLNVAYERGTGRWLAEGVIGRLRVQEWTPYLGLLALPEARTGEWLRRLAPEGELSGLRFRSSVGVASADLLSLTGTFEDVGMRGGFEGIPSLQGLDGSFEMVGNEAVVELRTEDARVDFHGYFRRPIFADTLSGELRLRARPGAMALASGNILISNEDIEGRVRVAMDVEPGADTFLDLRAHVYRARGASTYRYLPVGTLDKPVVDWLDRAITDGRGHDVDLLYYGRLKDFLDYEGSGNGRFEVRFKVDDATLDYFEDWPTVKAKRAHIAFVNSSMSARVLEGEALGVSVLDGSVTIPELDRAVVHIDASGRGDVGRMLEFLRRSPLRARLGALVTDAEAGGDGELELQVVIPVSREVEEGLAVEVGLSVGDAWLRASGGDLGLAEIDGRFLFTETGVWAEGVRAELSGTQLLGNIDTRQVGSGRWTTIRLEGDLPVTLARKLSGSPLIERLQGRAPWDVELSIAHDAAPGQAPLRILAESSLQGVALDLPPPLGKRADEARAFSIETSVRGGILGPVVLSLGEDLRAVFELRRSPAGGWDARRGAAAFGAGEPALPVGEGWDLAGRIERFSLSGWLDVLSGIGEADGAPAVDRLGDLNLAIGSFEALGYELGSAHISSRGTGAKATVRLSSPVVRGTVTIPASNQPGMPITAALEVLQLQPAEGESRRELSDPRQWPPIRATVGRLETAEHVVEDLRLELTPERNGVRLHLLSLEVYGLALRVEGDWTMSGDSRHRSEFRVEAQSEDIGAALTQLGLSQAIAAGSGEGSAQLRWPETPFEFDWTGAQGSAKVKIDKGSLRDIDPKAARLIGLFSIEALPRRLALDFDDMTGKGFTFDAIEGSFNIGGGKIRTQDLTIRGRAARIDLRGTVDMVDKDYDQVVTVTPKLDATLPIAGAIAGGTGVGAAVLVLQQIFKQPIQRSMQFQYTVTGPWDDPRIEPIKAPESPANDGADSVLDYE